MKKCFVYLCEDKDLFVFIETVEIKHGVCLFAWCVLSLQKQNALVSALDLLTQTVFCLFIFAMEANLKDKV